MGRNVKGNMIATVFKTVYAKKPSQWGGWQYKRTTLGAVTLPDETSLEDALEACRTTFPAGDSAHAVDSTGHFVWASVGGLT